MNLKQRSSFIFSCLFSVLLATVTLTVYHLFANFRQAEFNARLVEKAETTAKLLIQVKEIGYNRQKIIDKNSINDLYNENTQIYDAAEKLIYSSSDTATMHWTRAELDKIRQQRLLIKKTSQDVELGLYDVINNQGYYVLISAQDSFDKHLDYLSYLLLGAFVIGTAVVWILSFKLSAKVFEPLDNFRKKIQEITDSNLKIRLSQTGRGDEINALADTFNQMMDRIDHAYDRQREFTSNASHELRTPVARIAAQLENLSHKPELDEAVRANLNSIFQDTFQLSEVVSSLVALVDINSREHRLSLQKIRLDEIVYTSTAELAKIYPDLKLRFEIGKETDLEITGDETLLKIALLNLFRNAYLYSDNHMPECLISQEADQVVLLITNTGEVPDVSDTATLFTAFYRGSNTSYIEGSGIGLGIVKRILDYHQALITYDILDKNTNQVSVLFKRNL